MEFWNQPNATNAPRSRRRRSRTPDAYDTNGYVKPRKTKPSQNQLYTQWVIQFVGFFVLSIVVAIFVGWMQEKSGYQPQNLSSFLMFAFLFSALGTLVLNVGIKVFMPKASGGPAFFVMI